LEFKETPQEALIREIREETALRAECLCPIAAWTFIKDSHQAVGITFLCRADKTDKIVLSHEHTEYAWTSRSELDRYNFSQGLVPEMQNWDWDYIITKKEFVI